jgi:cell filamentation protein
LVEEPTVYEGTHVLKNKLNERDGDRLSRFERSFTAQRIATAFDLTFPVSAAGYCALHKHIFGDVYDWAGQYRTLDIAKSGAMFARAFAIAGEMDKRFAAFNRARVGELTPELFFDRLGEHISELNAIHPFREGNGRTMRAHASLLARDAGLAIDGTKIDPDRWMHASRVSFQTADYRELAQLLRDSSSSFGR